MNSAYGALELFMSYVPNVTTSVTLNTNILGISAFAEIDDQDTALPTSVKIELQLNESIYYIKVSTLLDGAVINSSDYPCDLESVQIFKLRIFFFNGRISVYVNNKWVYSYSLYLVSYPSVITQSLKVVGGTLDILDIKKVKLSDAREAVYVDYESTSDNAIASIIQERPIEMYPAIDRAVQFTYDATKDDVPASYVSSYDDTKSDNSSTSSDGLVYSMDVGISLDSYIAEHLGLITRLYRLPELDSGVDRAVQTLQRKARQSIHRISISGRLNPLLELSDVYVFDALTISGTQRQITDRVIIEDIGINIQDGEYRMNTSGRRDVDVIV